MKKRILHLTLHRRWFDAIATRTKREEYRKINLYWAARLVGKKFDEIHFRNGYSKNAPFMRVEWRSISCNPEGTLYVIGLGKVIEIKNWYSLPKVKGNP